MKLNSPMNLTWTTSTRDYLILALSLYAMIMPVWMKLTTVLSVELEVSIYVKALNWATVVFILSRVGMRRNAMLYACLLVLSGVLYAFTLASLVLLKAVVSTATIGSVLIASGWILAFGVRERHLTSQDIAVARRFCATYLACYVLTAVLSWGLWKYFVSLARLDHSVPEVRLRFTQLAIAQSVILAVLAVVLLLAYRKVLAEVKSKIDVAKSQGLALPMSDELDDEGLG